MKTLTNQDVLDAFDSIGGSVVQSMALRLALEKSGNPADHVVSAINTAIEDGWLGLRPGGGIFIKSKR